METELLVQCDHKSTPNKLTENIPGDTIVHISDQTMTNITITPENNTSALTQERICEPTPQTHSPPQETELNDNITYVPIQERSPDIHTEPKTIDTSEINSTLVDAYGTPESSPSLLQEKQKPRPKSTE